MPRTSSSDGTSSSERESYELALELGQEEQEEQEDQAFLQDLEWVAPAEGTLPGMDDHCLAPWEEPYEDELRLELFQADLESALTAQRRDPSDGASMATCMLPAPLGELDAEVTRPRFARSYSMRLGTEVTSPTNVLPLQDGGGQEVLVELEASLLDVEASPTMRRRTDRADAAERAEAAARARSNNDSDGFRPGTEETCVPQPYSPSLGSGAVSESWLEAKAFLQDLEEAFREVMIEAEAKAWLRDLVGEGDDAVATPEPRSPRSFSA